MQHKWGDKVITPEGYPATVTELDSGTLLDTMVVTQSGKKLWYENRELVGNETTND